MESSFAIPIHISSYNQYKPQEFQYQKPAVSNVSGQAQSEGGRGLEGGRRVHIMSGTQMMMICYAIQ